MIKEYKIVIPKVLKDFLKEDLLISSRLLTKLKLGGNILVNGEKANINVELRTNDVVSIDFDIDKSNDAIAPQEHEIEVLYEDEYYLAVNKPAGIVVHPSAYHPDNTLSNYVKFYLGNNRPLHPVNRLDRDTSGVVLFAKNEYAQELFNIFSESAKKTYYAICRGIFEDREGTIDAPIARKEASIIERCVDFENGQQAITHYKVVKEFKIDGEDMSLLEVQLETGRTHQIRVHMSYIGHPLYGETLYSNKESKAINRQALHAYSLEFYHFGLKKNIKVVAPVPEDIEKLM